MKVTELPDGMTYNGAPTRGADMGRYDKLSFGIGGRIIMYRCPKDTVINVCANCVIDDGIICPVCGSKLAGGGPHPTCGCGTRCLTCSSNRVWAIRFPVHYEVDEDII